MKSYEPLPTEFYDRPTATVARELLGKMLVRRTREGLCCARIVETEAYLAQDDPASHAFRGLTARNKSMFGPPGLAYVYRIHQSYCVNAVTEPPGSGTAVLIRAVEPVGGIALMQQRTGKTLPHHLARGPGKLCQALAIDRGLDGWNMTLGRKLWIAAGWDDERATISISTRLGISKATHLMLRYFVAGSRYVSGTPMRPKDLALAENGIGISHE